MVMLRLRWRGGPEAGALAAASSRATSSAWQVPHTDRSPALHITSASFGKVEFDYDNPVDHPGVDHPGPDHAGRLETEADG
ncbi:hypothetical protein [Streptomyces sp. NPDC014623]|uniref:hypothetical protein n=1 Tax=Streptomyces sp. NPDC014623 TaxID=3364875 RepID=UPI0037004AF5